MRRTIAVLIAILVIFSNISAFAVPKNVMYSSTRDFLTVLDNEGIRYTYEGVDNDNDEKVKVGYDLDDKTISVRVYFKEDLEECDMRIWNFIEYEESNESKVIRALDMLNSQYKWVKFYSDSSDYSVSIATDIAFRKNDVGEICREYMRHIVNICDICYSTLKPYDKNA